MLEAVERLKREYRHQYVDLMERHIAEQHRQVKEKDRLWEKKIAKRKEKEQVHMYAHTHQITVKLSEIKSET